MRALHTAATGMMAQELNVQVISNNIANMRTTGYKRQRAEFQDLLYEHVSRIGTQTSDAGQYPAGRHRSRLRRQDRRHAAPDDARHAAADRQHARRRDPRRRLLQDPAAGRHLLPIPATARSRWMRQGRIVTAQGNVVQPGITIPQNSTGLTINAQGQVSVIAAGHDHADGARAAHAHPLHQQGRPAGDRRQHVSRRRRPPARRRTACPAPTASATCSKAISNRPTSRR